MMDKKEQKHKKEIKVRDKNYKRKKLNKNYIKKQENNSKINQALVKKS